MKKNKIDVVMGTAMLKSPTSVEVTAQDGSKKTLEAKNIVVATGASAAVPPLFNVDGKKVVTYREAILQETLPASAVVVGASAIGCEFATVWNSYGTDVTLVEMLPRIVPAEDEEVSKEPPKSSAKNGIKVKAGTKTETIEVAGEKVKVKLSDGNTLEVDQVLVATGIKPNSKNLGLESVGVKLNERGFIEIDDGMRTNIPSIYAIGDVTGQVGVGACGFGARHCVRRDDCQT